MWWGGGGSEEDDELTERDDGDTSPPLEILAEDEELVSDMDNLSPRSTDSSPAMKVPGHRAESSRYIKWQTLLIPPPT